jgi:hypothetical protein
MSLDLLPSPLTARNAVMRRHTTFLPSELMVLINYL